MDQLAYVQARKEWDGYRLYWRGTRNEIFEGERFRSASEARNYFRAMQTKHGIIA